MSFNPEIIDLTSSSPSSSESDGWNKYFPPSTLPLKRGLTKEQASKKKHDKGETSNTPKVTASLPAGVSDKSPSRVANQPSRRDLVSPSNFTSDAESDDTNNEDPPYFPPSSAVRPKNRPRRSNPPLPKSREVVVGLPAP